MHDSTRQIHSQAVRRAVEEELGHEVYIPTMIEQMVDGYGNQIADPTNYKTMLATNSALAGGMMGYLRRL